MLIQIRDFFSEIITCSGAETIVGAILLVITLSAATLFYWATKKLLTILERVVMRSPTHWDDDMLNPRLLKALSQLAPAICVRWMLPGFFGTRPDTFHLLSSITSLYIVGALVLIICVLIDNLYNAFARRPKLKVYAIKACSRW